MCGREVRGSHVEGFFLQLNGFANWTLPLKKVNMGLLQAPTSVVSRNEESTKSTFTSSGPACSNYGHKCRVLKKSIKCDCGITLPTMRCF